MPTASSTLAADADVTDNLDEVVPLFMDESNLDLGLKPSSPALGISGFQPIPFSEIGVKPSAKPVAVDPATQSREAQVTRSRVKHG